MSSYREVKDLRKSILNISNQGGDGNLQSVFSALDLMHILYEKINCTPMNCADRNRDYFLLSKGQATLGLYCILAKKGFFDLEEVSSFCKLDSRFGMQADCTKFNGGIEISAGSLGHGLPMAVGVALAAKIQRSGTNVYTLVGDGEFNEGTMWEAALLAGHKKLDNLCIIIDDNHSIGSMLDMGDMSLKLQAFGFKTININGHNHREISDALQEDRMGKPLAIIADTHRGFGSETLMSDSKWFHRAPNAQELELLLEEVDSFEKGNV